MQKLISASVSFKRKRQRGHRALVRRCDCQSKNVAIDADLLPHLAELIDYGEITIGTLEAVGGVATAVDGSNCLAMLVRRAGETLLQLLQRLDLAVGLAFTEDIFTDEVNTPSGSSRSRK